MILPPGRPERTPYPDEVSVEILDSQGSARRTKHLPRIVPMNGPTACLSRGRESLAVHHRVGPGLRLVALNAFGYRPGKEWELPNRDTEDGPVDRRRYGIQAEPCVPIR
jgi:hypothetical protein